MKARRSILKLEQFTILTSALETIPFEENVTDKLSEYLEALSIDIDFEILTPFEGIPKEKDYFMVSVRIHINEEAESGYRIQVEGAGLFSLPDDSPLEDNNSLRSDLMRSGVNIAITSLRNYIITITAFSPFSHYTLPAIDMNDLFSQKQKQKETLQSTDNK